MKRWFQRFTGGLASVFQPKWRLKKVEDVPDRPKARIVYLVGETGNEWACAMRCPCGCRETIILNLIKAAGRPRWDLNLSPKGIPSIRPSVWRTTGCRAHFILRQGRIKWC
jgi:hypothetical protein